MISLRATVAALMVLTGTRAYRHFQGVIPNGDRVPHPCKPNYLWRGVGHLNPLGGGYRNSFGKDFVKYKQWSPELCRLDSDGDGLTNGQELGDPDCDWTPGTFPARNTNISHPGVCDPWGSNRCAETNKDVTCETGEFVCDSIKNPDVFNITLKFPRTPVPPEVTTYMCMTFDLDMLEKGVDYHLIAMEPLTDNLDVMHHTDLYTCSQNKADQVMLIQPLFYYTEFVGQNGRCLIGGNTSEPKPSPEKCYMTEPGCSDLLSSWVLGLPGQCFHEMAGFRFGGNVTSRIMIQHHWNNPDKRPDYIDGSGLILYMTRKLRPYNAGLFVTGQTRLVIPPGDPRTVVESTCTPECTELIIQKPIYFLTNLNHMHYLGYEFKVEQFRDGEKVRDLSRDDDYSYDRPVIHQFAEPIEIRPGDRLLTTCVFRTVSKATTTQYGEGTNDEMCFSFFAFYPLSHVTRKGCVTWDDVDMCKFDKGMLNGCDLSMFSNLSRSDTRELMSKVLDNCNHYSECRRECPAALAEALQHPCLAGKMRHLNFDFMRTTNIDIELLKFFTALDSCHSSTSLLDKPFPSSGTEPCLSGDLVFQLLPVFLYFVNF